MTELTTYNVQLTTYNGQRYNGQWRPIIMFNLINHHFRSKWD